MQLIEYSVHPGIYNFEISESWHKLNQSSIISEGSKAGLLTSLPNLRCVYDRLQTAVYYGLHTSETDSVVSIIPLLWELEAEKYFPTDRRTNIKNDFTYTEPIIT